WLKSPTATAEPAKLFQILLYWVKFPTPFPKKVFKELRFVETSPGTTKSGFPSRLKSPAAMLIGFPALLICAPRKREKVPSPTPKLQLTLLLLEFTTAKSRWPSLLKSALVIPTGPGPRV